MNNYDWNSTYLYISSTIVLIDDNTNQENWITIIGSYEFYIFVYVIASLIICCGLATCCQKISTKKQLVKNFKRHCPACATCCPCLWTPVSHPLNDDSDPAKVIFLAFAFFDYMTDVGWCTEVITDQGITSSWSHWSIALIIIPYVINIICAIGFLSWLRNSQQKQIPSNQWTVGHSIKFMVAVAMTGNFEPVLQLFNSRICNLPLFSMNLRYKTLYKYSRYAAVILNCTLERAPQFGFQSVYLFQHINNPGTFTVLATMCSCASILLTIFHLLILLCVNYEFMGKRILLTFELRNQKNDMSNGNKYSKVVEYVLARRRRISKYVAEVLGFQTTDSLRCQYARADKGANTIKMMLEVMSTNEGQDLFKNNGEQLYQRITVKTGLKYHVNRMLKKAFKDYYRFKHPDYEHSDTITASSTAPTTTTATATTTTEKNEQNELEHNDKNYKKSTSTTNKKNDNEENINEDSFLNTDLVKQDRYPSSPEPMSSPSEPIWKVKNPFQITQIKAEIVTETGDVFPAQQPTSSGPSMNRNSQNAKHANYNSAGTGQSIGKHHDQDLQDNQQQRQYSDSTSDAVPMPNAINKVAAQSTKAAMDLQIKLSGHARISRTPTTPPIPEQRPSNIPEYDETINLDQDGSNDDASCNTGLTANDRDQDDLLQPDTYSERNYSMKSNSNNKFTINGKRQREESTTTRSVTFSKQIEKVGTHEILADMKIDMQSNISEQTEQSHVHDRDDDESSQSTSSGSAQGRPGSALSSVQDFTQNLVAGDD